jgi:hypothetical protein
MQVKKISIKRLLFFLFTLILTITVSERGFAQKKICVNAKDFGAAGDGKKDDYAALLKIVHYINSKGTGEVYFPAGNYYIAEYHDGKNDIQDLQFKNCDSLYIHGSDAVISVNGNFNRDLTKDDGKHKRSNITAIVPLKIDHCKNVTIENLEFNGNVDKMTRDAGVVEAASHLLIILESQNVNLTNLFLHHSQTDGIYIKGSTTKNINGKSITSSNNARQGMSIIELTDATFTACKFINTGITEGKYGRHAPSAGVDIEPNNRKQKVNNIRFISCLFENNLGSQFVCSAPVISKNIFLNNSVFNSGVSSRRFSIIVNASNVVFEGCSFDCRNGSIYPVWHRDSVSSIFKRCNIKSNNSGFVAVNSLKHSKVIIDSCVLEYTGPQTVKSFFPYIRMQNLSFTNNVVQIPKQYQKAIGATTLIECANKSGNVFQNN